METDTIAPPLRVELAAACRAARAAGQAAMRFYGSARAVEKEGGSPVTEADHAANRVIVEALASAFPGDAILSEESADSAARLAAERVWIVDPLDGTREYSEPPRADWAVHVALAIGGVPAAGAVALPAQRLTLATQPPPPVPGLPPDRPRLIVSRTRPPRIATDLAAHLDGDLVEMGSAGAKVGAVIMGAAEIYAHAGGQYEWDSCAPVAVAAACGLHVSRLDGSPLVYNNADPYLPDLLVCHPRYTDQVLAFTGAWSPDA